MSRKWFARLSVALSLYAVVTWVDCRPAAADGDALLGSLLSTSRVEADPSQEYALTQENGPWMIMACSFSGGKAQEQARELALELRKRYKLEAYTHPMHFDFSDAPGRGMDQFGNPIATRYKRGNQSEEIAVLVGNYRSVDDPGAQRTLQKLKYTCPRCLELDESKPTNRTLAAWRLYAKFASPEKQQRGPMAKAFVTTNPLLPKDYFVPQGLDPLVVKMNENVEHSLLNCPGEYTVLVRTFKGEVVIKQDEIQEIENGKPLRSTLADAALDAHELTEALRIKGWEAYEFHDRYASIVTVGSFDSVGTPRQDGRTEINPQIHAIMRTFAAQPLTLPGQTTPVTTLKSVVGIPLDIQPVIVRVPKRSIGSEMARGLF